MGGIDRAIGVCLALAALAPSVAAAEPARAESHLNDAGADTVEGARHLLLRGRFPAAASALREVVHARPDDADAWRCLAVAYEAMGHAPEAVRAYRRYLALSSGAEDVEIVMLRVARLVRALGWDPGEVRVVAGRVRG
ncbi:MAG: tetratricopeptide repeat protein [Sandaracinaceae bacterium]